MQEDTAEIEYFYFRAKIKMMVAVMGILNKFSELC